VWALNNSRDHSYSTAKLELDLGVFVLIGGGAAAASQ